MTNEVIYLWLLSAMFIALLAYTINQKGWLSAPTYVIGIYTLASFCSISYYQSDFFDLLSEPAKVELGGVIYLFVILLIFLIPLIKLPPRLDRISVNMERFEVFYYIVLISSVVSLVYNFASHGFEMKNFLAEFTDIRNENYENDTVQLNIIGRIITGYLSALTVFAIPVSMFALFVLRYKRWLSSVFFGIAIAMPIYNSLVVAGRSDIVNMILILGFTFLIFKDLVTKNIYNGFIRGLLVLGSIVGLYVIYANIMRFEDEETPASLYLFKYAGESFVNFSGILYPQIVGYTYGISSFGLFRRMIGLSYTNDLSELRAVVERSTGTPGYIFYTFAGNFFRDFGPIITMLFGAIYAKVVSGILPKTSEGAIKTGTILILAFLGNLYLPGLFYFSLYSQTGNISIIIAIIMYFYLNGGEGTNVQPEEATNEE
ncbi:MAG: oligosaccharide repeat unit polymerase [Muribaculum sp.]|nr:oligosaccharide repeat unit polymerase [Muribaculum sp.]